MPKTSPELIFKLRESAFANDLFITAVSYFDFFNFLLNQKSYQIMSILYIWKNIQTGNE